MELNQYRDITGSDKRREADAAHSTEANTSCRESRSRKIIETTQLSSVEEALNHGSEPVPVDTRSVSAATITIKPANNSGAKKIDLTSGDFVIGRKDVIPVDVDLTAYDDPDNTTVSRQHACVHFDNGEIAIEDLGSANGTFVNGIRIRPGLLQRLDDFDSIEIGAVQLKLRFVD